MLLTFWHLQLTVDCYYHNAILMPKLAVRVNFISFIFYCHVKHATLILSPKGEVPCSLVICNAHFNKLFCRQTLGSKCFMATLE